jgi:hypothetical protein
MTADSVSLAEVEPRLYRGLTMAMAPLEAQRRLEELQAFVKSTMKKDEDYGTIPGTDKPTLYQPGAQKLAELYGFSHKFITIEEVKDWERGFFFFYFRCVLTTRADGSFVGEGIGNCNSKESKYAGRWVPASELPKGASKESLQCKVGSRWVFRNEIPEGMDIKTLQTQERTSKKNGSKYNVFKVVDEVFLVPNPDPYSLVNTITKMASKRAYIHAVIAATRSSGLFNQDIEDLPKEAFGQVEGTRPWEAGEEDDADVADPNAEHARLLLERADTAKTREEVLLVVKDLAASNVAPAVYPGLYARVFARRAEFATTTEEMSGIMREIGAAHLPKAQADSLRKPCRVALDRINAAAKKAPVETAKSPAETAKTSPEACHSCGGELGASAVAVKVSGVEYKICSSCDQAGGA